MAAERRAAGRHIVPQSCSALEQVRREWEALVAEGRHTRHELWLLGKRYGISSGYWVWEVRAGQEAVPRTWALACMQHGPVRDGPALDLPLGLPMRLASSSRRRLMTYLLLLLTHPALTSRR